MTRSNRWVYLCITTYYIKINYLNDTHTRVRVCIKVKKSYNGLAVYIRNIK